MVRLSGGRAQNYEISLRKELCKRSNVKLKVCIMNYYKKFENDFKRLIKNNKLFHAYFFFGEDEEDIFLFAQALANFLENGIFSAQLLSASGWKETLIVSPNEKGTIGIDAIRFLKNFLWQKSIDSKLRIVIIKGSQNLTPEAQNAALKIAEEPPESALIIFIAKTAEDLLPALNSRFQKIYFPAARNYAEPRIAEQSSLRGRQNAELRGKNSCESTNEIEVDQFFKNLIGNLKKDPIKNSQKLKETLRRLTLIKEFNTNKRLQMKTLNWV